MNGWRIGPKYLTDEQRDKVIQAGGLSGLDARAITEYERSILAGLQHKSVYQGTVDPVEVARRRGKNRNARRARAGNVAAIRRQARANLAANRVARFRRGHAPDPLHLHVNEVAQ